MIHNLTNCSGYPKKYRQSRQIQKKFNRVNEEQADSQQFQFIFINYLASSVIQLLLQSRKKRKEIYLEREIIMRPKKTGEKLKKSYIKDKSQIIDLKNQKTQL
ncbi:unnamed protein product (macronuclear) [Paramecium tetraurelia]|uniref:Uncharacterized protein n=1 Tax=Paramecium tetraurelia TaxID=5888 RepID=A0DEA2_PARTE|nr:uncharacterized protein GSPATT00039453001 [Paramecium tetraurelia]CAK81369.1 unnamed protein product [Paramecium tetraurelia]|eukprot:XP_001448766.1 hypothetical protein (macronuclear) [Paramecium tetraurelia strain d4-2]